MTLPDEPATPQPAELPLHTCQYWISGLTKREYFAALAMQGAMACPAFSDSRPDKIAEMCVEQADFLIAALNKPV